jgi:hypothetical protein
MGYDVVQSAVSILPPLKPSATGLSAFATLKGRLVIGGMPNNLVFALNTDATPVAGLNQIQLYLKRHGDAFQHFTLVAITPQFTPGELRYTLPATFQLPENLKPLQVAGADPVAAAYDVDLRLIANPNESEKSVLTPSNTTFVYFNSENDSHLQFPTNSFKLSVTTGNPIAFDVKFGNLDPTILELAYPGWSKAGLKAMFSGAGNGAEVIGSAAVSGATVHVTMPWATLKPSDGSTYAVTISTTDGSVVVPVNGVLTISVSATEKGGG